MNYVLSIIIPTKDRYIYLKECLKTLNNLSFKDQKVEVIVQDNTIDNKEIVDYLNDLNSNNIKYFHCTDNLSQTGNSDLAMTHVSGKYCCYIGDDDTITIAAIRMAM